MYCYCIAWTPFIAGPWLPCWHRFIDLRTASGFTALHFACCFGHLEVVKALLQAGASLSVRTSNSGSAGEMHCAPGSTPLHLATVMGNGNAVLMLLEGQVRER
jgi:ankyrin repeat protein